MSHLKNLREHIIHLLDSAADEDAMVRVVRVLERHMRGGDASSGTSPNTAAHRPTSDGGPLSLDGAAGGINDAADGSKEDMVDKLSTPRGVYRGIGDISDDDEDNSSRNRMDSTTAGESSTVEPPQEVMEKFTRRREGVSAVPTAMRAAFVPRVIPKTEEQMETIGNILAGNHLFAAMQDKDRVIIANALERDEFPAGSEVLKQGVVPNPAKFYILFEGTCEVIKGGKHVASLATGNTFGELEVMTNNLACAATIRTVTPCVLYSMDQETYRNIVQSVAEKKREEYLLLVENVSFLDALSKYDKSALAEALVTANYYKDDHIISFGEKGTHMHIIVEGEVQVVGRDKGRKVDVVRLGPGNVVGELEFLFDHLTVADVVAATKKVQTAKISRKHFEMVLGPITDDLKQFVAKKGNYEYYMREADDSVKKEIEGLEKRVVRIADEDDEQLHIAKLDKAGEIVVTQAVEAPNGEKKIVPFRYPLFPLQDSTLLLFGIREDATIVYWSTAIERLTNFPSSEVVGQSLYTFMHSGSEQSTMHNAIIASMKFKGRVNDDFYLEAGNANVYTIQRRDGLTKVKMSMTLVPPAVAHGKSVAEVLLAVGTEVKVAPPQTHTDYSHWLTDQVRVTINDAELDSEAKLAAIGTYVTKFESLQQAANHVSTENLSAVRVRDLIGQVVSEYAQGAVEKGNIVTQHYDDALPLELYCDAHLLPECLRYAMSNCVKHLMQSTIEIDVAIVEEYGVEFLRISFSDNGPGFPKKILEAFQQRTEMANTLNKVREAVEKQGGEMTIESPAPVETPEQPPKSTRVNFKIPFMPHEEQQDNGEDLGTSKNAGQMGNNKQTFTTLVIEDLPAHRNLISSVLWERKHAVLPGYTYQDIQRLQDVTDILMVDFTQSVFSDPSIKDDPFSILRNLARNIAVILTGENIDPSTREAAQQSGFFTLRKPCTHIQAVQVLRKAEEKIMQIKAEQEKINATRNAFNSNNRGEWTKGKLLGKGAFGEVYEAIDVLTGGKMAVKNLRVSKDTPPEARQQIINEIEVMCTLQHPNIIHYFFAEDDIANERINVIMEFAAGGSLEGLMKKGPLSHQDYVAMLRDIVAGVEYVHSQQIVHRDLKTANVLLNSEGKGKLGDFGTAKRLKQGETLNVMVGTLQYMAPEVISAGDTISTDPDYCPFPWETGGPGAEVGYSFPADIWSLGCIALEMATNAPPFSHLGCNSMGSITNTITHLRDVPDLSPLFDKPPTVIQFVEACLNPDPVKRPLASELVNFDIFQEAGSSDMANAMKILKKRQLLAILEKFVAFQDPEEIEAKRLEEQKRNERRTSAFQLTGNKGEDAFFASSGDEDEDDDDSGDGDGEDDKKGGSGSGDNKEAEDAKKTQVPAVPIFQIGRGNANSPTTNTSNKHSPRSNESNDSTRSPLNKTAPAGSGGKPQHNHPEQHSASAPIPPPPVIPNSGRRPLFGIDSTTSIPRTSPRGHHSSTPVIPTSPTGVRGNTSAGGARSPAGGRAPPQQQHREHDNLVINLHDALLMLVDRLRDLNNNIEADDALKVQYNKQKMATTPGEGSGQFVGATFQPNITELLSADAELIRNVAKALGEKTPSSGCAT